MQEEGPSAASETQQDSNKEQTGVAATRQGSEAAKRQENNAAADVEEERQQQQRSWCGRERKLVEEEETPVTAAKVIDGEEHPRRPCCLCSCTRRRKLIIALSLLGAGLLAFLLWWFLSEDSIIMPGTVSIVGSSSSLDATITTLITAYWTAWLHMDQDALVEMLRSDGLVISQQTSKRATSKEDALQIWQQEWSAYEMLDDETLALGMRVHDVQIRNVGKATIVLSYWLEIAGGVRWEFDDTAFVTQIFDENNKLLYHADSWNLDYDPTVAVQVETSSYIQSMDYVYPVIDMDRAAAFYDPILGPPEVVMVDDNRQQQRIYDMQGHRFILDTSDLDGHVSIQQDLPSAYPILYVEDIEEALERIQNDANGASVVTTAIQKHDLTGDKYFLATDPGSNIIVMMEILVVATDETAPGPSIAVEEQAPNSSFLDRTVTLWNSWLQADDDAAFAELLDENTLYFDDSTKEGRLYGYQTGSAAIIEALRKQKDNFDRNPDTGLSIDVMVTDIQEVSADSLTILSYKVTLAGSGNHPFKRTMWATDVYDAQTETLMLATRIRSRLIDATASPMAKSLDYTANPINAPLRRSRRFYQNTLQMGEPYKDTDWFGFYSFSAAYGIYRSWDCDGIPRPQNTNGYASLWINDAQQAYDYLLQQGASFPIISAINEKAGVDEQPGYTQVVTSDSEGNILVLTEYPSGHRSFR